jgi:hypothetical protein
MKARLGNVLFWTVMLLAALWFLTVLVPGQSHKDNVTANIVGGLLVLIGLALRYTLNRVNGKPHEQSAERVVAVIPPANAVPGYEEPTTILKDVANKLLDFEHRIQRIEAEISADGIAKSNHAATLYNRALVLEQKGNTMAAITFYTEVLQRDPTNEDAIAALNRLRL